MKKDIKKEVIEKIKKDDIKIRSKKFFMIMKFLIGTALIFLGIAAVYIFNLSFYLPRRNAGGSMLRPVVLSSIPWGIVLIGSLIIGLMIYIYTKHEGGYKKNLLVITILIAIAIISLGGIISASNLNEKIEQRRNFRRMYDWGESNFVPGGRHRLNQERLPFLNSPKKMKYFE